MRTWVPSIWKMRQNSVKTCLEFQPAVLQVESLEKTEMLLHICPVLRHFHSIYHSFSGTLVWPMATIYIPNISWKALEGCLANIYFFLLWLVVEPLQVLVGVKGWGWAADLPLQNKDMWAWTLKAPPCNSTDIYSCGFQLVIVFVGVLFAFFFFFSGRG